MDNSTRTSLFSRALQVIWIAAPFAAGWGVSRAPAHFGRDPSSMACLVAEAILAAVWAGGLIATFRLDPALIAGVRIAGAGAAVWGVAGSVTGLGTSGAAMSTWGVVLLILASSPQVATDRANRTSPERERRFPLATPLMLTVGIVTPATLLAGYGTGLLPAMLLGARPGAILLVIAIIGIAAAVAVSISLARMGRRWLVAVPSGAVLHDPLLLEEVYRLAPDEIAWVELAPRRWRQVAQDDDDARIADATGGCTTRPVIIVLVKPMPGPMLRALRGGASPQVNMIACRPSNRADALAVLRAAGYERPETGSG